MGHADGVKARHNLNDYHLHADIEATNLCNTRCLHCPHELITRPLVKMDWGTYQTVLDKITAYTSNFSIEYRGIGEPLLNPSIYDFIGYVSDKCYTSLTTNGSALTPANIQRLIEAGLGRLTISFNGDEAELYQLMMGKLSFERAQENLLRAVELCRTTRTEVAANVSVTIQTRDRLASIKQYLNDAGITNIFFSQCHSRGGFLKEESIGDTPMPPTGLDRCDIIKNTLFVSCTGVVLSCCQDLAGDNVLGDLKTEPLETILARREEVIKNGVNFEICKSCNDLFRFMDDRMFDGRSISDWVYDLYTTSGGSSELPATPLDEWIFRLYSQESKARQILSPLVASNHQLAQQVSLDQQAHDALMAENQALKESNRLLALKVEEIQSTRTWRLLTRIHAVRQRLFSR